MLSVTTEATVTRERPHPGPSADHERPWSRRATCRAPSWGRSRLLEAEQAPPHHEQVRERARDHEPMAILVQPTVAHLREAEDAFDHPNGMFDAGANAGFPPIRRAPFGRGDPTMDEVPRVRRAHAEDGGLARVRRVAPDPPFVAVQQPGQDVAVVNVGRRDFDGMNQLALAVDPEVALHAEIPLPALLRLMHPGIARARGILRGGRGGDDRRVDDGARADGDALGAQV